MKKKNIPKKHFPQTEKANKEMIYSGLESVHEELKKEREKEDKEFLLTKLREITRDKHIVFSNYVKG